MKRLIDQELTQWKQDLQRKVLLLRGARQVGKTYAVRKLGRSFTYFLEVNFEEYPEVAGFFNGSHNPDTINEKLSAYFNIPIIPNKTLLFFDEIQACPEALRTLRFYHEKFPKLHVIAAGSLLEFALEEIPSFGVGRLQNLFMYPMSFREFLIAQGETKLDALLTKAGIQRPLDEVFHQKFLEYYRTYQLVGGMPAVVEAYGQSHDLQACGKLIDELITTLQDDFAKYKKRSPLLKLQQTFRSIALQSGAKFKYAHIADHSSTSDYNQALELLVQAGLAHKIYHTAAQGIPLGAQIRPKRFKAILFDLGIHQRLLGLDMAQHLLMKPQEFVHKGSLTEVFVGLELLVHSPPHQKAQLYYWHREARGSQAEVDYVIQRGERILPLEVKAGTKGQMQSLRLFLQERNLNLGIRLSQENFSSYENIQVWPLYAVEKLLYEKS